MLRVGLTGGIGSGKSTVAERFRELGAVVIDADLIAREVVAAGSPGLAAVRQRFGDAVIAPDGSLDRASLGAIVFADTQARKGLEAIAHPLIQARTAALMGAAAPHEIVVHDVPLLAELDLAAAYHLTVVVGADDDIRVARLTGGRGFTEADARARIAAQVGDQVRRAAADVWLDNNGTVHGLLGQVDALWHERMLGFNDNLMKGSATGGPETPALVPSQGGWPAAAVRLSGRVRQALGEQAVAVEHIGSTSVPGLPAMDVIDLQVGVRALTDAHGTAFISALADKGFPSSPESGSQEVLHGSADPGQIVRLYVREMDGPAWYTAILLRDWLRAEADERDAYGALERRWAQFATTMTEYAAFEGPWLEEAFARADAWAGQLLRKREAPPGWRGA